MLDVVIDNFMLQSVTEVLADGLTDGSTVWPEIDLVADQHRWREVPAAAVQLDALFQLLIELVTRDRLLFDGGFRNVWRGQIQLHLLEHEGLLSQRSFEPRSPRAMAIKDAMIEECTVTTSIRRGHAENVEHFRLRGESKDRLLGTLMWGTAGMIARGCEAEAPYAPHPQRSAFLRATAYSTSRPDAVRQTLDWIDGERVRLYRRAAGKADARVLQLVLSPLIVQLIEACEGPEELIPTAVQLRDEYKRLRGWLEEYQQALDAEDLTASLKKVRELEATAKRVAGDPAEADFGSSSVSIAMSMIELPVPMLKPAAVRHRVGVATKLNGLLVRKRGEASLRGLIRKFGATPNVEQDVMEYFRQRAAEW